MLYLLKHGNKGPVEAKLFVSKYQGKICSGAFILRSDQHLHYLWGAMDREFAKERVGESVQWAVIEWACEQACSLYDLEGIHENNPGVSAFKKKMGGQIINMPRSTIHHVNWQGRIISQLLKKKLQWS